MLHLAGQCHKRGIDHVLELCTLIKAAHLSDNDGDITPVQVLAPGIHHGVQLLLIDFSGFLLA